MRQRYRQPLTIHPSHQRTQMRIQIRIQRPSLYLVSPGAAGRSAPVGKRQPHRSDRFTLPLRIPQHPSQ